MMQFYFLSVITNLLIGFMLGFEKKAEEIKYLTEKNVRLAIGITAVVTGIVKLFIVSSVPVFGDFIPFVAGVAGGFTLILEYYMNKESVTMKEDSIFNKIFIVNKKIIGYVCLAAGALHFLFPKILFL